MSRPLSSDGRDGSSDGRDGVSPQPPALLAAPKLRLTRARIGWLCFLLLTFNLAVRAAIAWRFPLLPEEAYCWQCSFFPSWGYVEHPPMAVWLILACRSLVGSASPLAIRLGALMAGTAVHFLVYSLALQLFRSRMLAMMALIISLAMPGDQRRRDADPARYVVAGVFASLSQSTDACRPATRVSLVAGLWRGPGAGSTLQVERLADLGGHVGLFVDPPSRKSIP